MSNDYSNPKNWDVNECVEFLKTQDMEMYKDTFIKNGIDGECLLKMKESDLRRMGIKAKGHRIRLREGIKKLKALTKEEMRKKLRMRDEERNRKMNRKLNQLVHPESMDQKLLSYYDKLDIVEEGNSESEENSK